MPRPKDVLVTQDGVRGVILRDPYGDKSESGFLVEFESGHRVILPPDLIERREDGSYYVPLSVQQLKDERDRPDGNTIAIPVVAEKLNVQRRPIETGGVRVSKRVHEREEVVAEPGFREEVEVQRVPINRMVEGPVSIREEGDALVIPVLEEVLHITKRLMLREEIRITKRRQETKEPQRVVLRSEEAVIEQLDPKLSDKPSAAEWQ